MRKYGYLVVEGPHDVAFACRLLRHFGLKCIKYKTQPKYKPNEELSKSKSDKKTLVVPEEELLDKYFHPLIPESYPLEDGNIQNRIPIPVFLQSKTHAIAIHSAGGDSRLVELIEETNWELPITSMVGVGILLDADTALAQKRYTDIKTELAKIPLLILPDEAGIISLGKPNLGAFVLPDNQTAGTLEDLLLESAKEIYPLLLKMAKQYVSDAKNNAGLKDSEIKELKNAGENKAIIGAMANIMKPGKAVQNSIQDNRWLSSDALKTNKQIKAVQDFLRELFDLKCID